MSTIMLKGKGILKLYLIIRKIQDSSIHTIITKPSEGFIFHPLTLHRSVPPISNDLKPRYSVDIRYYDSAVKTKIKVASKFKIKKIFKDFVS